MRRFSALFAELDATTSTNAKVAAMRRYLETASPADGAWAVYLLSGRRMKRLVGGARLRRWLVAASGLPEWLVEESHQHVGDLAETIALLLDDGNATGDDGEPLHRWIEQRILSLRGLAEVDQQARVTHWWRSLPPDQCFLFNKLLTGSLRVGVSQTLLERALAEASGRPRAVIAHRLMGEWTPTEAFFESLFEKQSSHEDASRPYPFFLAYPLENGPEGLDAIDDWLIEWKWDGIRAQLVRRERQVFIWSRGEELITDRFPEIGAAAALLPDDHVLDGEILAWNEGVLPFAELQRRIGRKNLTDKLLREVPAVFLAYDLLEQHGADIRERPQSERRTRLEELLAEVEEPTLKISPTVAASSWHELAQLHRQARERKVEGFMLKRRDSAYGTGRRRGPWWKWKVEPLTIDAVLIYAQPGHGRRANLYTDYTFAVWNNDELVPVAKAYSGLEDSDIREMDRWIRRHTVERFGPVRSVEPAQVCELAFEGINPSKRHKSGVALRFPRIARWRRDLGTADADTLDDVKALLDGDHR